jgi:hypothetical protein
MESSQQNYDSAHNPKNSDNMLDFDEDNSLSYASNTNHFHVKSMKHSNDSSLGNYNSTNIGSGATLGSTANDPFHINAKAPRKISNRKMTFNHYENVQRTSKIKGSGINKNKTKYQL